MNALVRLFFLLLLSTLMPTLATAQQCNGTAGYQEFNVGSNKSGSSIALSGLDESTDFYINLDGIEKQVILTIYDRTYTYNDLAAVFNSAIPGITASMVGGNLRITSKSLGSTSKVILSRFAEDYGDFSPYLQGYQNLSAPVSGTGSNANCGIVTPPTPQLATIPTPAASIDQARSLPAQFDVTSSGQATYKIPIVTAPGSAGLVPEINLRYSSGGGNGIAGLGWSLSAYGSISRCRQTEGVDHNAKPITWTTEDRFCLNGERLLLASGTYGYSGSTYKTEIDSFARVTAVGGSAGTPNYFTVEYKDGVIETYGNTSDSANSRNQLSTANVNSVLDWALSKRSDSAGNKIIYTYINDADGQRLNTIDYAFGSGYSRNAYVQFNYEGRNDPISGYVAGYGYKTGKRLTNIKSYNGSQEIRSYTLTYNQGTAYTTNDKLSRINKIQECVLYTCSPATEFEWELPDYQLAAATSTKTFPSGISVHAMGDFNGDGLQDIAWFDQTTGGQYEQAGLFIPRYLRYAFGSISTDGKFTFIDQVFSDLSPLGPRLNSHSIKITDVNHDGRMDIVVDNEYKRSYYDIFRTYEAYLSTPMPDGTWKLSSSKSSSYTSPHILLDLGAQPSITTTEPDLNSDGLQDAIVWPIGDLPWDTDYPGYPLLVTMLGKFDGGYTKKTLTHVRDNPALLNGIDFSSPGGADFSNNMDTAPILKFDNINGDFNGDGAVDVIADVWASYSGCGTRDDDGNRWCDSRGGGSVIYTLHKSGTDNFDLRYYSSSLGMIYDGWDSAVDLNNDGLSDIITRAPTNGWGFSLNDGKQFASIQSIGIAKNQLNTDYYPNGNHESLLVDINGDGYQDFVWQQPVNSTLLIGSSNIKARYWDPLNNVFESQEKTLGSLNYKILINFKSIPRFKAERFNMSDVNGDGIPDLVTTPNTQTNDNVVTVRLGVNSKKNTNKIVAITNGLGEKKKIKYGRVNENTHYTRIDGINANGSSERTCEDIVYNQFGVNEYTLQSCWDVWSGTVDATKFYQTINDPWFDLTTEEQSLRPSSPILEAFGPTSIVTDVEITAPTGSKLSPNSVDATSTAKLSYYYGQAKIQAGGRGFLGFKTFTVVNRETGIRTETEYRQDWPFIGQVRKVKTFTAEGNKLSQQENIWGLVKCYDTAGNPNASCVNSMSIHLDASGTGAIGSLQTFLRKTTTQSYALKNNGTSQGDLLSTSVELNRYDDKGNPLENSSNLTSNLTDGMSKSTVNTYNYSGSTWSMQLGRLEFLTVTASNPKYGAITRSSSFDYYQSGAEIGLLKTETVEPNNPAFTLATAHSYNQGNKVSSVTTANGQTRQSEIGYDTLGRYVDKTYGFFTNGSNPDASTRAPTSEVISRDKYGTPTEVRAYTGNSYITKITATTDFGTPYFTADSTGSAVEVKTGTGADTYNLCPADTKIWSISKAITGNTSLQCLDLLGRERRKGTLGFDGSNWSLTDTEYDKLGRVLRTSAPYASNSSERYWTTQTNDVLGRNVSVSSPYKSGYVTTTTTRDNLKTTTTNPKYQTRTETIDLLGHVVNVQDPLNGNTQFAYDARGNMREMRDPAGNTTVVGYDLRDRKTSMSDPDKGNWIYKYNSFGDLTCQQDGKGQISTIRYDIAGRTFNRIDRFAGGNCDSPTGTVEKYTEWTWDTAANGMGQLASVKDSASIGGSIEYQQTYTYDGFGRAQSTTTTLPGHLGAVSSHYEKITYDQYGRPFQNFDAARITNSFDTNGVQNIYNAQGYLTQVIDAENTNNTQKSYYKINTMNVRGNVTNATWGNGITQQATYYPETGLTQNLRADRLLGVYALQDAVLDWDELGNLKWREEHGAANDTQRRNIRESFGYDSLNRLTNWASSGDLVANETANFNGIDNITDKTGIGSYKYGTTCGANTNAGPHALCSAGSTSYNYDKNGNMLNDSAGRGMVYTTYDMPSEITKAGHKTTFSYGPSRARYKRVDTEGSQTTTTLYLGSVEKVYYPDGTIQWKRNISGVGLITQTVNSSGTKLAEAQRYLIKDHLGSLSLVTDEIGAVEQSNYFDPWGKERKIITAGSTKQWTADTTSFVLNNKPITTRGFTGHEQLAEAGLIHMNGRIYDGALGRFVQADPVIQDPMRVQSLNRYSYVWNNPLNATDPSGFRCVTGITGSEKCTVDNDERRTNETQRKNISNNSGLRYKITDQKALDDYLKKTGQTMDGFTKSMADKGISKAGFSDSGSTTGGIYAAKGNQASTSVNQSGENSTAASEAGGRDDTNAVCSKRGKCTPNQFTKDEQLEIQNKIDNTSAPLKGIQYKSMRAALVALHTSGLVKMGNEDYGIELWAQIDAKTFEIYKVSTGFYGRHATGANDLRSEGDIIWHNHPGGSEIHSGDLQSIVNWSGTKGGWIFASGNILSGSQNPNYFNIKQPGTESFYELSKRSALTQKLKYENGAWTKLNSYLQPY